MDDVELLLDIEEAFAIELPVDPNILDFSTLSYLDFVRYLSENAGVDLEVQMANKHHEG